MPIKATGEFRRNENFGVIVPTKLVSIFIENFAKFEDRVTYEVKGAVPKVAYSTHRFLLPSKR